MKIVVIGGSGLIGSKVVAHLKTAGHDVLPASPNSGVNAVTGENLAEALTGAEVVVDVANSPSFADEPVMEFFTKAGWNLAAAEKAAGVRHHVALSVVGTERLLDSGYFRAKLAQEEIIKTSPIPYTIVRATQFFEFVGAIAQSGAVDGEVRLPSSEFQPIASDDVATAVAEAALAGPINGTIEIAGPERVAMDRLVASYLAATGDPRSVVGDTAARYFGIAIDDRSLTPDEGARLFQTRFADWLQAQPKRAA
ncbi:MAG: SDR family oxidoreductase [Hansschlegelia sp.]